MTYHPIRKEETSTMTDMTTTQKDRTESGQAEATRGRTFTPRVDIYETDQELVLLADVPGVKPEDVDLRYDRGELILHAKVTPPQGRTYLLSEFEVGDFYRVFTIHESIDSHNISAEVKKGVLTVHLPKAEPARPRQINVKAE
jgi:HSP20 family protein